MTPAGKVLRVIEADFISVPKQQRKTFDLRYSGAVKFKKPPVPEIQTSVSSRRGQVRTRVGDVAQTVSVNTPRTRKTTIG